MTAGALTAGPVLATPASATPRCEIESPADECAPGATAPISQVVGTVSAPLVDLIAPCPAPWQQGGVSGSDYNACNAGPVFQQEGVVSGGAAGAQDGPGFAQVAAAPVQNTAPIHQTIGTVGAPLVNVNIPCPAPWNQGGVSGADYNACNAAPVFQQEGSVAGGAAGAQDGPGFAQVAAAPVQNSAPIHQTIGTVGAPLVNVNIPCPAPWQQGGVSGSDYNACNAAPVFQQEGVVSGAATGGPGGPGFAQVAAAPVQNTAPIHQIIGTVGAPLVNVNIPCPAPWQQGGLGGSNYNACNAAAVFQQPGSVQG